MKEAQHVALNAVLLKPLTRQKEKNFSVFIFFIQIDEITKTNWICWFDWSSWVENIYPCVFLCWVGFGWVGLGEEEHIHMHWRSMTSWVYIVSNRQILMFFVTMIFNYLLHHKLAWLRRCPFNDAFDLLPIDICDVERYNLSSPLRIHMRCRVASHWSLDLIRPINRLRKLKKKSINLIRLILHPIHWLIDSHL